MIKEGRKRKKERRKERKRGIYTYIYIYREREMNLSRIVCVLYFIRLSFKLFDLSKR